MGKSGASAGVAGVLTGIAVCLAADADPAHAFEFGPPRSNAVTAFASWLTTVSGQDMMSRLGLPTSLQLAGGVAPLPPSTPAAISVTGDQTLSYSTEEFPILPDEHQTFIPSPAAGAVKSPPGYQLYAATTRVVDSIWYGWTFLFETPDLYHLSLVPYVGDSSRGNAIFWSAQPMPASQADCTTYGGANHFDEQYAAPGSVLQDPTLPPGNMLMIYEGEIHCPYSTAGGAVGWASVGVAHSIPGTNGQEWPAPTAASGFGADPLTYGNGRYAGITSPGTPLAPSDTSSAYVNFNGDDLPSAFIDDVSTASGQYVYAVYSYTGLPGAPYGDGGIHVARAKLGGRNPDGTPAKLQFSKWLNGGWDSAGIGGADQAVAIAGCNGTNPFFMNGGQIDYDEALGLYMLTYNCERYDCSTQPCTALDQSWYYVTTSDLSTQQWSAPRKIFNSTYTTTSFTDSYGNLHYVFDGNYPTFMTPGCPPGHLGLSGDAFLLSGDPVGTRTYASRAFTIEPGGATVHPSCGPTAPPPPPVVRCPTPETCL